jgi:hypothetical protein
MLLTFANVHVQHMDVHKQVCVLIWKLAVYLKSDIWNSYKYTYRYYAELAVCLQLVQTASSIAYS